MTRSKICILAQKVGKCKVELIQKEDHLIPVDIGPGDPDLSLSQTSHPSLSSPNAKHDLYGQELLAAMYPSLAATPHQTTGLQIDMFTSLPPMLPFSTNGPDSGNWGDGLAGIAPQTAQFPMNNTYIPTPRVQDFDQDPHHDSRDEKNLLYQPTHWATRRTGGAKIPWYFIPTPIYEIRRAPRIQSGHYGFLDPSLLDLDDNDNNNNSFDQFLTNDIAPDKPTLPINDNNNNNNNSLNGSAQPRISRRSYNRQCSDLHEKAAFEGNPADYVSCERKKKRRGRAVELEVSLRDDGDEGGGGELASGDG